MEFEVGSIVEGKVTGITKFGAFVSLPGNKSGLVHISEISHSYVNDVHEHLTEGQEVKVKVISIDENNRINLSIKKAMPAPPRPQGGFGRDHRGDRSERPRPQGGRPPRQGGFSPRNNAPKEPATFDDMLKQFMQESDSRQSDYNSHYTDRRGGGRRGGRH